jgi:glycosyltransferase involved in cell wall biosynthesis
MSPISGAINPLVSVVIPTFKRPELVLRAIRSALAQTVRSIEVIVVTDGPDDSTVAAVTKLSDGRVRLISLPVRSGANAARNAGIQAARGEWAAMLDDDDEWLPHKLEKQLELTQSSKFTFPIVSCLFYARSPHGDMIRPTTLPYERQDVSDYLFGRRSFLDGEAYFSTITLLARTTFWKMCPFSPDLRRHQEADWVLRATRIPGVGIEYVREPLAIAYTEQARATISNSHDWKHSLAWVRSSRPRLTKRAYSGFILGSLGSISSQQRDWRAFFPLLWAGIAHGRPTILHLALYFSHWLISPALRRKLRWFVQLRDTHTTSKAKSSQATDHY